MKLTDDFNDNSEKSGLPVLYTAVAVIGFIVLVFCVVLAMNSKGSRSKNPGTSAINQMQQETQEQPQDEFAPGESKLTSDQLDFWNMYEEDEVVSDNTLAAKNELYEKNAQKLLEEELKKQQEADLSEGGTKTMVVRPDGTEQWIMINSYLEKNTYDKSGFVYEEPVMKYYENGKEASWLGVDIDKNCGDVDFKKLKKDGVDYVMIRIGYRGYESGLITIDEEYFDYIQEANEADMPVGIYFESKAVSAEEALEEAEFVIANLVEMRVTYPVVFDLGLVSNDSSRIDMLPKTQLTEITNTFCNRIKEVGYTPMVYGDKYWLLRKIDLTMLGDYDIWLSQIAESPDYPYEFAMWQYTTEGSVSGISGNVNMNISFIDYSQR
nr:glycoside hydrolase family 25 protein [Lachnospiraceae bacterium]